ncbi:MAG: NAD(P)-binding domain-containing protein, partial [Actinobacteria bacterium]|nr:NAD(P)-binding domain-containing protein [Actinomycetota bacterium]
EIAGSTLGIVGLGTIGKEVAQRARAFEMRVLAHDLAQDQQFAEEHLVMYVPLEQLLRESDYVSLHVFLDQRTQHLINAEHLAMMKPSACLINTARGPIVDEEALIQALEQKQIAGAALDVFTREPLPTDSPLRALDNVYLYPHLAGSTQEVFKASGLMAAENVIRVLRGERPLHTVNPEALDM